ncbi:MAG: 3-deoxy-7-phosphoheptulonate synthase, partial [Peptococcaceae bacterium]|nr:3-deoxy-7-phosphoheptulonate synthase [Peptococcaceae bacterium]
MIFVLKPNIAQSKINNLQQTIETHGFRTFLSTGTEHTVICLIGNTALLDLDSIVQNNEIIEYGKRVTEPYKAVNRTVHPDNTIITVGTANIGEGFFQVISGPCSVESEEQIIEVARSVKASGATLLRGGAFKPRTSPYAFMGLHEEGINLLLKAKKETGLPIVTEI